jgi:ethanolamine ammonia-lyase large subunit
MNLKTKVFGKVYSFKDIKDVLAKANEVKSGDILAGISASSSEERIAARIVLSELTLWELYENPVVPYEEDEVTRIIQDNVNNKIYKEIKNLSVGELRNKILSHETSGEDIRRLSRGFTSEMVAAAAKLMSNMDLIYGANKIIVTAKANTTIGLKGCLASRLQPNHPTDDVDGMLNSLREGLSYGCGDAVIGINPVDDSTDNITRLLEATDDMIKRWNIPTQNCVLAHMTTQMEAISKGAPSSLIFQSIAGSEKGNRAFGININLIKEARDLALREGTAVGPNVLYFETGQGSELSSNSNNGADQVVMEARCYGLAKQFEPFLVNTVVGFIGPEYLYDNKQVIRAGLEDHFMGKLTGVPMGVDACYTNHMKADQNDIENLAILLTSAGCNYFMSMPMGIDVMLNYQSTSYHDIASLRTLFNYKPLPEFEKWMESIGIYRDGRLTKIAGDPSIFITNEMSDIYDK